MDMKLEVVPIPVRNVDAAKDFYTKQVGFSLDHDVQPSENMRVVHMTPHRHRRGTGPARRSAPRSAPERADRYRPDSVVEPGRPRASVKDDAEREHGADAVLEPP